MLPQININSYQSQSLIFMFKPCKCCLTLLWVLSNSLTLFRILSYSHDQDHVHSTNTRRFPHGKSHKTWHPYTYKINMTSLSKTIIRDMGFAKRNKEQAQESMLKKKKREEKRCIPKEGMPYALEACQNKRCIPKEGMSHALRACQKKEGEKEEKIAHVLKENEKRERWFMTRSFIHHPPKISTHSHILIKVYDLFLLGSWFWLNKISKENMPLHYYPGLQIDKAWLIGRGGRQQLCLGQDYTHLKWVTRENNLRSKTLSLFSKLKTKFPSRKS